MATPPSYGHVTPAGAQVAMHSVRPGELFAEASLFSARYHCDAVASRASEVLVYPKREVVPEKRLPGVVPIRSGPTKPLS